MNNIWLIFGTSPYLYKIENKIPDLIKKYHTIGINKQYFNYEYIAFLDNQTFNEKLTSKLIINYQLTSTLKMKNDLIQDDWVIKPEYISNNDYPISLLLGIEFAIHKKADEIVIIASELKNNLHFNSETEFSKTKKEINEINNYLKTFKEKVKITQIGDKNSLLNVEYRTNSL